MSVGIAYRLRLRAPEVLDQLLDFVRAQSDVRGWVVVDAPARIAGPARLRTIEGKVGGLDRVDLAGLWLNPHFGADDACLVFDRTTGALIDPSHAADDDAEPLFHDFGVTRTTYADATTQIELIDLLEQFASRDLASVELGDPSGSGLPREQAEIEIAQRNERVAALRACLVHPTKPIVLGGIARFLAPDVIRQSRAEQPQPVDKLDSREGQALLDARAQLLNTWLETTPGLDGKPAESAAALETLCERLLSSPSNRHEGTDLNETFVWQLGATLGFALIEALGGHWQRSEESGLEVVNLGGVGLTWAPLKSGVDRLNRGPLHAPDRVLTWCRGMTAAASEVFLEA
jgi:hypothetical protein